MMYLVDTNVLSEPPKPVPSSKVIDWLTANERNLAVDSVIVGELCVGILSLPDGPKRRQLEQWFPERRPGGPARSWRADRRRRARGGRRTGARPHHGRLESDQSVGLALSRAVSQAVGSLSLHLRFNARRILCHRARAQGFIHTV